MATPSASSYNADAIEVLSGLDPVRKRPGMYTDTSRPNHLAQEVIDNSVDEALAGHAKAVHVILHADHSLEVSDDGRGMPVDIHPEEGVPGVELILTKLHAGGKFSNKNYQFSGGLHGVGISVVNALSNQVEVKVKRDGNEHRMTFADGFKATDLEVIGSVGKRNTGTSVRFWPDPKYFDSPKFSISRLKHVLKAKAVLCPGLEVTFTDKNLDETTRWYFEDGLRSALREDHDVILLGEMRDLESISITLTLAETGHLVFGTLHTNDAAQALDRLVDVFPGEMRDQIQIQLAGTLQGVISQRLLRASGGGRVAAYEVLMANDAVRNLVREGKSRQLRNVMISGQGEGMQTIEMDLARLVAAGLVDIDTAMEASAFPKEIMAQAATMRNQMQAQATIAAGQSASTGAGQSVK